MPHTRTPHASNQNPPAILPDHSISSRVPVMALGLHPEDADGPAGDISVFGVTHLPLGAPTAWSRTAGPASYGIETGVEPGEELVVGPDRWKEHRVEKKEGILAKRGGGTSVLGSTRCVRSGAGRSGGAGRGGER